MSIAEILPQQNGNSKVPLGGMDLAKIKGTSEYNKLIADCNEKFEEAKRYRLQFEQQWYMNLAFYFGKHYVNWSTTTASSASRLIEGQVPPWRVRLVSNKVRRYIRKEMSKLLKERPMGFVVPESADDDDIYAARAGDVLAEWFWRTKELHLHVRRAVFWSCLTGTGFIKDWYDETIEFPDKEFKGDVCLERVSPFHIYIPDVQEEDIENQPYVIHGASKDPSWVQKQYDVELSGDSESSGTVLEEKFLSAMGIKESSVKKKVFVKEMWVKPNQKYPDGVVIVWAGNNLLYFQEGWPFLHKNYPFTKFSHIPTGQFYGDSTIVDLIPLQKEYNRTNSQVVEAKNRMAKPQLLAAKGSIDPNKLTSEPGLIIQYTPGFAEPKPLDMANLPAYVENSMERCVRDMDDIASQHDFKAGNTGGIRAATAISFLQEEDDSILSPMTDSIERGVEKIIRHVLNYVGYYWDDKRTIQVTGENDTLEVMMLSKDVLKSNYSWTVQAGSSTPRSLAAKQAFILDLVQRGLIPGDKALRFLGMPDINKLFEELQIDSRQQQRENLRMQFAQADPMSGEELVAPPVNTWDNHFLHLEEVDRFRKTQSFENLDDAHKQLFEQHARDHKIYILVKKGWPIQQIQNIQDPLQLDSLMAMPGPAMMQQQQAAIPQPQAQLPTGGSDALVSQ